MCFTADELSLQNSYEKHAGDFFVVVVVCCSVTPTRKTGSSVMQLAITRLHITVFLPYAFIYKCRPVLLQYPAGSTGRDRAVSGSQPADEDHAKTIGHCLSSFSLPNFVS